MTEVDVIIIDKTRKVGEELDTWEFEELCSSFQSALSVAKDGL